MTSSSTSAHGPTTLAIDIGGTGLKALVLDAEGGVVKDRVRIDTTYPMPPDRLVSELVGLVEPLGRADRASVGFPGVVRDGKVVTAPAFVTADGLGSTVDEELLEAWSGFDLDGALTEALGCPVRAANDADIQGAGAVSGEGIEVVVTLGTGFGSTVFRDGRLALHLELAHHPLRKGATYNEVLGDASRRKLGNKKWTKRVNEALAIIKVLIVPDRILVGGGNAEKLKGDLPDGVGVVDNRAGLLGGLRLWEEPTGVAVDPLIDEPGPDVVAGRPAS